MRIGTQQKFPSLQPNHFDEGVMSDEAAGDLIWSDLRYTEWDCDVTQTPTPTVYARVALFFFLLNFWKIIF